MTIPRDEVLGLQGKPRRVENGGALLAGDPNNHSHLSSNIQAQEKKKQKQRPRPKEPATPKIATAGES
jgi:hypothetical protein